MSLLRSFNLRPIGWRGTRSLEWVCNPCRDRVGWGACPGVSVADDLDPRLIAGIPAGMLEFRGCCISINMALLRSFYLRSTGWRGTRSLEWVCDPCRDRVGWGACPGVSVADDLDPRLIAGIPAGMLEFRCCRISINMALLRSFYLRSTGWRGTRSLERVCDPCRDCIGWGACPGVSVADDLDPRLIAGIPAGMLEFRCCRISINMALLRSFYLRSTGWRGTRSLEWVRDPCRDRVG